MKLTQRQERISKLILDYLRKNPSSADTLRGIAEYWIELERIDVSVDEIEHALSELVREGSIERFDRNGASFYRTTSPRN